MSTVATYNPLKRIRLPGAVIEDPAGLIIVIGPNSSGKTLFLNDIQNHLSGSQEPLVVCKSFAVNKPTSLGDYLNDLVENHLLKKMPNFTVRDSFREPPAVATWGTTVAAGTFPSGGASDRSATPRYAAALRSPARRSWPHSAVAAATTL